MQLLLEMRENARMSREELAKQLGRPQSFVSKIETSERHLTLPEIEEICGVLNISLLTFIRQYQGR